MPNEGEFTFNAWDYVQVNSLGEVDYVRENIANGVKNGPKETRFLYEQIHPQGIFFHCPFCIKEISAQKIGSFPGFNKTIKDHIINEHGGREDNPRNNTYIMPNSTPLMVPRDNGGRIALGDTEWITPTETKNYKRRRTNLVVKILEDFNKKFKPTGTYCRGMDTIILKGWDEYRGGPVVYITRVIGIVRPEPHAKGGNA